MHFKVRHTTKFEKVRAFTPRGARRSVACMASATRKPRTPLSSPSRRRRSFSLRRSSTRSSLQPGAVRFLFDGQRINPHQTLKRCASLPASAPRQIFAARKMHSHRANFGSRPRLPRVSILSSLNPQLDMEDGDSIDAMMEQVGGCQDDNLRTART